MSNLYFLLTTIQGSTVSACSLTATIPNGLALAFFNSSSSESISYYAIVGWDNNTDVKVSIPWSELNITVNSLISFDLITVSLGSISKGEW